MAKAILAPVDTAEPLGADEIAETFTSLTLQRMTDLRILDPQQRRARSKVKRWLGGG